MISSLQTQIARLIAERQEPAALRRLLATAAEEINELKSKRDLGPVEEARDLLNNFLKENSEFQQEEQSPAQSGSL